MNWVYELGLQGIELKILLCTPMHNVLAQGVLSSRSFSSDAG
jgi:hypothetical protein